jgi:antitoxin (DNA-binding transcriptional repressor) of toxin-antitoxin stability system
MRVISPLDLRRSLGAILDAASAGERFLVERDRRPLAMLVSVEDGRRLDPDSGETQRRRLAALDRLEALASRPAAVRVAAPGPAPSPAPAPTSARPLGPIPTAGERDARAPAPARDDPHQAERRRHADEGLVGLG